MAKVKSQKNIYDEKSKLFLVDYTECRDTTSQQAITITYGDLLKIYALVLKSEAGDDAATAELEDFDAKLQGNKYVSVSALFTASGNDVKKILASIKRGLTARGYATVMWEEGTYGIGFNKKETENAIYRTEARHALDMGGF